VETNRQRLIKKWGGEIGWERQKRSHDLKGRGRKAGIPHFNLDRLTSNTMASHRLIQHVGKRYGLGVSEALYDVLNVYYFVDGHALNDRPRLAKVSSEALTRAMTKDGSNKSNNPIMTEEEILKFLEGSEGRKEINKARDMLHQLGIHSIPQFIIEGNTLVNGAAEWDTFVECFRAIEERGKVAGGPIFADILGIEKELIMEGSHSLDSMAAA